MNGLIMDYQLTIPSMLRRAEQLYFDREIVTRLPDKSRHRYTYADMVDRTKRLSLALTKLGVERRRPGGHVLLEPLPASGSLFRHSHRPAACCTRSTCDCTPTT